ncbi:MAG: helix-turn-helix transcriptional regulator [Coriobacteriales bacterium]|jgi:DNA-binding CsgD family transcriptional regulator|nr:helix-turn-helix transcriptional regulator [Coriobacteriales bacterium]
MMESSGDALVLQSPVAKKSASPHHVHEAQGEGGAAAQSYGMRILPITGYSLYLVATIFLVWPDSPLLFSGMTTEAGLAASRYYQWTLLPVYSVSFAFWSLYAWFRPAAKKMLFSIVYAASMVTGALLLLCSLSLESGTSVALLAGVFLGFGLGSLSMTWARIFSIMDFFNSSTGIVASGITAAVLYFILSTLSAHLALWLVIAAFVPIVAVIAPLLIKLNRFDHPAFNHRPSLNKERYAKQLHRLWRPCVYAVASAFVWGLCRSYCAQAASPIELVHYTVLGFLVAFFALIFTWRVFNDRYGFIRSYRVFVVPFMTCALLLPFFGKDFWMLFLSVSSFMFFFAFALILLICCRDADNRNVHPMVAWGLFSSATALASYVFGYLLLSQLIEYLSTAHSIDPSIVMALVYVYVVSLALFVVHHKKTAQKRETQSVVPGEQIIELAKKYALTSREIDVAELLAKGRDVYYISEKLVISINTVQYHCRNIYKKLGIHRKQELIDIFNNEVTTRTGASGARDPHR